MKKWLIAPTQDGRFAVISFTDDGSVVMQATMVAVFTDEVMAGKFALVWAGISDAPAVGGEG